MKPLVVFTVLNVTDSKKIVNIVVIRLCNVIIVPIIRVSHIIVKVVIGQLTKKIEILNVYRSHYEYIGLGGLRDKCQIHYLQNWTK